jgi:hypothetical protein
VALAEIAADDACNALFNLDGRSGFRALWPSEVALLRLDPARIELTGLRQRSAGLPSLVWRAARG